MSRTYNPQLRHLPSDTDITEPFYRFLPQVSSAELDNPVSRIDSVVQYLMPVLPEITDSLFTRMTNQTGENTLQNMGKVFFLPDHDMQGTSRIHSLHRRHIVERHIHPEVAQQFGHIYDSEGVSSEERLARLALIAGTMIAQTQGYHDGNKRIARTVHDFIKHGPSGVHAKSIFTTTTSFMSPHEVEIGILTQNSANIIQGAHEPGVYSGENNVCVEPETEALLSHARGVLAHMRDNAEIFDRYNENRVMYIANYLSAIHRQLPEQLRMDVISTLHQREYGAAALACLYVNRLEEMRLPLGMDDAYELNDIDTELLIMRVLSLTKRISEQTVTEKDSQQGMSVA